MNYFKAFPELIENRFSRFKVFMLIFFIIGVCFYYLFEVSWLRWGNLIVDTSRELWVPQQLMNGRILYKDLVYPFGFFPPYFLALLYKIFGVSINTLVGCGIGVTALMSLILYRISRFFLDEVASGLVVLTFLFELAFGYYQPNNGSFNFILPYSFASTFFILFTAFALYFFLKFIFFEKEKYILSWCIFLSFAFFSRIELTLPIWVAFVLLGGLIILKDKRQKYWKLVFYLFLPVIITLAGYFLFLLVFRAFGGFRESIIGSLKIDLGTNFFVENSGFHNIHNNIFLIAKYFISHSIMISLFAIGSFIVYSSLHNKRYDYRIAVGAIIIFTTFAFFKNYLAGPLQYKCLPLILLIGIFLFTRRALRSRDYKEDLSLLTLFLVSTSTILRIFLNTSFYGYGFYLLSLSLICYYVFFIKVFINYLPVNFKGSLNLLIAILIVFFIFLIKPVWSVSFASYALRDFEIKSESGTYFYLPDKTTQIYWQAVDYLKKNTLKEDKVVVLPQGASINFFAQRENPLRYYQFFSLNLKGIDDEKMISQIIKFDVEYILIVYRPITHELGRPLSPIYYGEKLNSWIYENYEIIKQFGPPPFTSNAFGIAVLKKKTI